MTEVRELKTLPKLQITEDANPFYVKVMEAGIYLGIITMDAEESEFLAKYTPADKPWVKKDLGGYPDMYLAYYAIKTARLGTNHG